MVGIFMQSGHEYREARPRVAVTCAECGKQTKPARGATVGAAVISWEAHKWYRKKRGAHVCVSCWEGTPDAT